MNSLVDGDTGLSPMSPYHKGEEQQFCAFCGEETEFEEIYNFATGQSWPICPDCLEKKEENL